MHWPPDEKTLRRIFAVSVVLKGLHALAELVGGIAVLVVSPGFIVKLAAALTAGELAEDPHDFFANRLIRAAGRFSVPFQHVAAFYLISHGLVIGFLVIGLLRKKRWSYPAAIAVLSLFIAYQLYQFGLDGSWWLLGVTILDLCVVLLTVHEYRSRKQVTD